MSTTEMSTGSAIKQAAATLEAAGVQTAERDAVGLAAHVWSTTPDAVSNRFDEPVPEDFWKLVERRAAREPLELIVGVSFFSGRRFLVEPGVFVPKPETEELVERVVEQLRALPTKTPRVVDLCSGSGVVAITVPYIPAGHTIGMPEVRDHDPALALWGGSDGLDVVRSVERTARRLLTRSGWLFLEHGPYQVEAVLKLFGGPAWSRTADHATVDDAVLVAQRTDHAETGRSNPDTH